MSANDGPVDPGTLEADAEIAIRGATTTEELAAAESAILGKRSALVAAHRSLGGLDPEDRRTVGAALHEVRGRIERLVEDRRRELAAHERVAALEADRMDLTEVVVADVRTPLLRGHQHLVTTTREALEDVFVAMGFTVAEGPEAETDWYNFEALNIPPGPPGPGHVRQLLPGSRRARDDRAAHPHLAGPDPPDGTGGRRGLAARSIR